MKKIVFTGGGTVGHVTLNLLLIPKFLEAGWQVHYIGDKHGIEYQEVRFGYHFSFYSDGEITPVLFLAKYVRCIQSGLGHFAIFRNYVKGSSAGSLF